MLEGIVIKIIDNKTASVNIVETSIHPVYGKVLRKNKKIMCHINGLTIMSGDKVLISESRPYSKTKKHVVVKKI